MKVELKIPEKLADKMGTLADSVIQLIQVQAQQTQSYLTTRPYANMVMPSLRSEEPPTEEEKATVEAWLNEVDPVVQKEALAVLREEIRGMMLMGGNVKAIAGALKKGKKPKLVRKKEGRHDPLFIQLGDGVEEPIEEIHVFG